MYDHRLNDFSRLSILGPKKTDASFEVRAPSLRTQSNSSIEEFQDAPDTPEKGKTDRLETDSKPKSSNKIKCPEFVSMTVKGKAPDLMVVRNKCRFRLGKCMTPRVLVVIQVIREWLLKQKYELQRVALES